MPEDGGLDDVTEEQVQRVPETQQLERGSQHSEKRSARVLFACSQGVSPGPGCRRDLISAYCWLRTDLGCSRDQTTVESWELSARAPTFVSSSLRCWTHHWIPSLVLMSPASDFHGPAAFSVPLTSVLPNPHGQS